MPKLPQKLLNPRIESYVCNVYVFNYDNLENEMYVIYKLGRQFKNYQQRSLFLTMFVGEELRHYVKET